MTDTLFTEDWTRIDTSAYVNRHREAFDRVDLKLMPHYLLVQKMQQAGLLLVLLENDPLKDGSDERTTLNKTILKEIRWQTKQLATEYNWRVEHNFVGIDDSLVKTLLGKHIELLPPDPNEKAPAQVIGMKTLSLASKAPGR